MNTTKFIKQAIMIKILFLKLALGKKNLKKKYYRNLLSSDQT